MVEGDRTFLSLGMRSLSLSVIESDRLFFAFDFVFFRLIAALEILLNECDLFSFWLLVIHFL
jgi:hypothetical protein